MACCGRTKIEKPRYEGSNYGRGNSGRYVGLPDTIKEILQLLIDEKATIILRSGEEEHIEVEAVVGNLLVARVDHCKFKFVDICCICAVIVECEEVLEHLFREKEIKKRC